MGKRKTIKTTKKEIVWYWSGIQDECYLSVDWAEADQLCWKCGYKRKLERCHIVPDALGGEDKPENLVLLCHTCHKNAPNTNSVSGMWEWLKAEPACFYGTYWNKKILEEYEKIYHLSYEQELDKRNIISFRDLARLTEIEIEDSVVHFGEGYVNCSTRACQLKKRFEIYDIKYKESKKSNKITQKELAFEEVVRGLCFLARKYRYSVWEGRTKNPFSVTASAFVSVKQKSIIAIKLGKDMVYRVTITNEINPNNNRVEEYTIGIGTTKKEVIQYVEEKMSRFTKVNGYQKKETICFTYDPLFPIKDEE